ncbi:two-component system NtrC family sensor kinase [Chromohalobacter marismortui]|uniref:histidine kinase n=1 Tax=Chromohalobacter marismortui TaxID=42055 RepID=A0A4R7NPR4_9GAMM|nr:MULTISPECIES: HAMP domain-containing sensor histidine kinase [Chromohalobacter]MCI0508731.1 cache domain-containing protein [Chromohalobacter sp.]MCI0594624.1 cache domain-containing protein [Chromohalobacter sp.]TDU22904.1 two-component system NtrC family sensor kinase [Chromohalobacter marismortui]
MRRLRRWLRASIRRRLLWLTFAPMALLIIALTGLTAYWTSTYNDRQLYMKVRADLAVASRVLDGLSQQQQARLEELAHSHALASALQGEGSQSLEALLDETQEAMQLDWLRVVPLAAFETRPELHRRLHSPGHTHGMSGLDVLPATRLETLAPGLAQRARLELHDTPQAAPSDRRRETRGMVLRTLYPIHDDPGHRRLLLDGGRLLNGDAAPVDDIRDLVYGPGTLPEGSTGSVTLFLDDVRIATNVRLDNGERALGTRVSEPVSRQVLERGERFIDSAFVVSGWYVAAYAPLTSLTGQRIGMIYAGFPLAPYEALYRQTLFQVGAILAIIVLISGLMVIRGIDALASPIRRMHRVIHGVREGRHLRIGHLDSQDELAELAHEFDAMLDRLDTHQAALQRAAQTLERRVEARTQSLTEKTRALEEHVALLKQARASLMTQEKLAALGEMTAGIAHEINNPAAVILGHVELLDDTLGPDAAPVRDEIDTIIAQVERIRALIDNLLQYSRAGNGQEPAFRDEDINAIAADTEVLVRHALDKHGHRLIGSLHATRRAECHRGQLQQVLINLLLNATQASTSPMIIHLATRDTSRTIPGHGRRDGVEVRVADQGPGIPLELRGRVFDPFFTTREAGSGLGLAISAGIVRRSGGEMWVASARGRGSIFHVWLPCQAFPSGAEDVTTRKLIASLSDMTSPSSRGG